MIRQSITAVVLPAGTGPAGTLRANVYLAPRLSGAHLLSDFPDWLQWASLVHDHGLRFDIACGARSATINVDQARVRPDVWHAIFGHGAIVDPYPAEHFDTRLLVSYPTRTAEAFVRWAHQLWALRPPTDGEEGSRTLEQILEPLLFRDGKGHSTLDDTLSELRVQMYRAQQGSDDGTGETGTAGTGTGSDAAQVTSADPLTIPAGARPMAERLALFHRHLPAPRRRPLPSKPHELEALIDFHKALTALAGYPALLPAVGLVFPLELPTGLCTDSPAGGSTYQTLSVTALHPGWSWSHPPTLTTPETAYAASPGRFTAAPATPPATLASHGPAEASDVVDGFLVLTPSDFHLVEVDVDGAMLKLLALANGSAVPPSELDDARLPALRSGGLALIADGRAQEVLRAIRDNNAFETGVKRPLNARDLTRGYRLDIYSDRTGSWHSLHRRDGTYRLGDGTLTVHTVDEEGFTQLGMTQPADDPHRKEDKVAKAAGIPQPSTDLYLSERIARWNGWSLSAPRPATPINRSANPAHATDPDPTAGQPVTTFKLASSFVAHPRSLPSLRFGERYRIRARAVDLAGSSAALDAHVPDDGAAPADGLLPYYRYEPVAPPVLVLRAEPGPGGSLAELVIRTYNTDPGLDTAATGESDERHIAPPRAGQQLVEHHGMLDDAGGHLRADLGTYELLVARDRAEIASSGHTAIDPSPQLPVSYLADPLARGAALTGLPQTVPATDGVVSGGTLAFAPAPGADPRPTAVTQISFGPGWPEREAFRVRLAEGGGPPVWDYADRVLTVSLAKAQTMTTQLSCYMDPRDLDLLGVWDWLRELFEALDALAVESSGAGADVVELAELRTKLTALTIAGNNEQLTPSHPLTFTHAVLQPLGRPAFTRLPIDHASPDPVVAVSLANSFSPVTAWRSLGSHHAVLLGALQINGASTAAIDLEASWTEWTDDPAQPTPASHPAGGHVERITLTSLDGGLLAADGTDIRQVAVYIPRIDALWFAATFDKLDGVDIDGVDSPPVLAAPIHQLGDTKHRIVRYRATASSRFQEYFTEPGAITSRTGPALAVNVPSSARPLPPDIAYVVPLFGWESQVSTDTKTEVRRGNALRVYLRRPWYSSGVGELLGAALWPQSETGQGQPTDDQREGAKALITQWGLDPTWQSGPLAPVPAIGHFPLAVHSGTSLTLEKTDQTVDVAGHTVAFDPARRLWYCDIELDNPTAYAPFIRLALVRYQPRSIPGVELSKVTLADFAQLSPDRSAALTMDPADPARARLLVAGLAPNGPTQSFFTAIVEKRRTDVLTDLGWARAAPSQAKVTIDAPPPAQPDSVLLAATITFAKPPGPGEYRLVVREFEVLEVDPPDTALNDTPEIGERLVFAAIIPIDRPLEEVAP